MSDYLTNDQKWTACLERNLAADGQFFIGVKTTAIYCRPVCPARPLRKNTVFFDTFSEAQVAGFRACKRCNPAIM
jgi:AraC family transcriptional regulator, regulatory protein of adaptative response / methylated-DNA-[protein]-cysteine methyltransferase